MSGKRTRYNAEFKAKVASWGAAWTKDLVRISCRVWNSSQPNELAAEFEIHPNQIVEWKKQLLVHSAEAFSVHSAKEAQERNKLEEQLYEQIGRLKTELDWLKIASTLVWASVAGWSKRIIQISAFSGNAICSASSGLDIITSRVLRASTIWSWCGSWMSNARALPITGYGACINTFVLWDTMSISNASADWPGSWDWKRYILNLIYPAPWRVIKSTLISPHFLS